MLPKARRELRGDGDGWQCALMAQWWVESDRWRFTLGFDDRWRFTLGFDDVDVERQGNGDEGAATDPIPRWMGPEIISVAVVYSG
jgi:hypothetical protein